MPIYEYVCAACGHHWELIVTRDAPVPPCPLCDQPGKKAVSAPAFQFKGSGWYVTDYAKSGADSKKQANAEGAANKTAESKSSDAATGTAAKSDSPATKTEAPATQSAAPAAAPAKVASPSTEKS